MKKLLCLVFVFALALSAVGATAEEHFAERIPVEISIWEIENFGNDAWSQFLEDKFNCDIIPIAQDWGNYQDQFRLLASSNDLPDCFAGYPLSEPWFADFVSQEMIRTIPQEMIDKYPNVKATCEASAEWHLANRIYGDIYYLPRMLSAAGNVIADRGTVYYRADWAEKLGFTQTPADMETLYNMLYAFAHNDPDGNGKDDTYGMVAQYNAMYAGFDAYPSQWVKQDGGVIPGYLDKAAMVKALTWLRNAYENGVIDPELSSDIAKWTQGTFGAYGANNDAYWVNRYINEQFGGANPDLDPMTTIKLASAFSEVPGGVPTKAPNGDTSGTVFAYDTSDAEMERLIAMYDYLLSDEGNMLRYWGFEGEDYKVNEDGTYTKLHDTALRTKYPSIFLQNWPSWDHDFVMDIHAGDPSIPVAAKEMSVAARAVSNAAYNPETTKVDVLASYLTTEEEQTFMFDYEAELVQIIIGTEPVETMYDAMVQKAYDAGVQEVIDSINALEATF